MLRLLKYLSYLYVVAIVLIILARVICLLYVGHPILVAFHNMLTPICSILFWKIIGIISVLFASYHFWHWLQQKLRRNAQNKATAICFLLFFAIVASFQRLTTVLKNIDLRNEYHYTVPHFEAVSDSKILSDSFQKGANVFGWELVNQQSFEQLKASGIEWVSIMPFEYQLDANKPNFENIDSLPQYRRKDKTIVSLSKLAKSQGKGVMLKPHIWVRNGWRDQIGFSDSKQWDEWFKNYSAITLQYAQVAQDGQADLFCIGTEMKQSILEQPKKWRELIKKIKNIYSGKLTYAANWDREYQDIPFWDQLDFIGIQAYFPMKIEGEASVEKLKKSVTPYVDTMARFAKAKQKQILFTEFGYRSIQQNFAEPWDWPNQYDVFTKLYCEDCQLRNYKVLLHAVHDKPWFAGGYIWEYDFHEDNGPLCKHRFDFSPRHKKAEPIWTFY